MPFIIGIIQKMKNSTIAIALLMIVGCGEAPYHPTSMGYLGSIIPAPSSINLEVDSLGNSFIGFFSGEELRVSGFENLGVSENVVMDWFRGTGIQVTTNSHLESNIVFILTETSPAIKFQEEGYTIDVASDVIKISALTPTGLFRGFMSLRQMMPVTAEVGACSTGFTLPCCQIDDVPKFEHRGLLLDCCRHFMEPEFVMKMIDNLALHKMNVLHWHLTEDQGWRIEIDAYPLLTEIGSQRTELDGTTHGGFYTKETIREIIKYAEERHVEIIPEIEIPGHSQAALAAYPWLGCTGEQLPVANKWGVFKDIYCAGNDTTLRFLETVLDEVCELFPSDRIHIGGDEAPKVRWAACDKCQTRINSESLADEHELQTWIIEHVGKYLETKGKTIIGWDEILEGGLPEGAAVQSWRGMAGAIEGVRLGTDVIASPTSHCYLDYPLNSTDLEQVYSFNPVPEEAANGPGRVIGGECNMWSERAPQHLVESKVFPRAIALAEVLWSGAERTSTEGAYDEFLSRLDPHLNRLAILGVDYGLESIPVSLSLAMDESDDIYATITPAGKHIRGSVEFVPSDGSPSYSGNFSSPIAINGIGELVATINYRGRVLPAPERFSVASHAAVFRPLELGYEPSPYYTGGGDYALVDGRLGSLDFRDGAWQALQGGDMEFTVDLGETTDIASISLNFYRYQDAWIFPPRSLTFFISDDGEVFRSLTKAVSIVVGDVFEKNDVQEFINFTSGPLEDVQARFVMVSAQNPGVCPDWHAAATEPTWLFVDELVVIENH
jgi:hexosaminidase